MMRVLVVDDNKLRVSAIQELFSGTAILADCITYVDSVIEAKRKTLEIRYDLMLLDLVLPTRTGEHPSPTAGIDLLHEMVSLKHYKLPKNVFVISEYDNALDQLPGIASSITFATIKYDASSEDWKLRLHNYIEQLIRADSEHSNDYLYDAAILCALPSPELAEVIRLPFNWVKYDVLGDSTTYYTGSYEGKKLICASAYEMGMSAAAILATKIITKYKPKFLIMTGIVGGADKEKLNFGDVMVADPCFDYGSGKRVNVEGKSIFKPDYRQVRLDDSITKIIQNISTQSHLLGEIHNNCGYEKPNNTLQIKIGPFGSGAAVLTDQSIIEEVAEHNRKFLGFDMEAYGVMLAGSISNTPKTIPVVLKSVSDFGDGKDDRFQKYASYTSAKILELLIPQLP